MKLAIEVSKDQEVSRLKVQKASDVQVIDDFIKGHSRKTIVVQGLGFVGSAMTAALSIAKNAGGDLLYNVIGVEKFDDNNRWKIEYVNSGRAPVASSDERLNEVFANNSENRNILATSSEYAYSKADVVVVDVNLDVKKRNLGVPEDYTFSFDNYKKALSVVAENIKEETLVILETTVPPGTTEKQIHPLFKKIFDERGLDIKKLNLAFSYERVMPGPDYLNSIINYYRVYSGINGRSKKLAREFLESFINTDEYPLFELGSPRAAETSKILENTYRAMNIAFIQEWTRFAHQAGIDLFEVIDAIRVRPTHKNIMYPGFGVGGYCLPKDTLLADYSSKNMFEGGERLGMSLRAIGINDMMPQFAFELLKKKFDDLKGINVTILGVSYRSDVADTRNSPAELFYEKCIEEGVNVELYDELADVWEEKDLKIETNLDAFKNIHHDAVVFAVNHSSLVELSAEQIITLFKGVKVVIDANNVIDDKTARSLWESGVKMAGVGKGHWDMWGQGNG